MKIVRPYEIEVTQRVERLAVRPDFTVTVMDHIRCDDKCHPWFRIVAARDPSKGRHHKKDVLISGGVHGSEPAGTYSVLEFLDKHADEYLDEFRFFAYPCQNPYGFERHFGYLAPGTRLNLNRSYKYPPLYHETALLQRSLREGPARYDFVMDMHETDVDDLQNFDMKDPNLPDKFYMWETCHDHSRRVGHDVIKAVRAIGYPICEAETIWGDINSGGVMFYPEAAMGVDYSLDTPSCDLFLHKYHTAHAFTTETFTAHPLEDRVSAHITALKTVLYHYSSERQNLVLDHLFWE